MSVERVVHGDFCGLGIKAIFQCILDGTQSINLLACSIKAICISNGEHTDECCRLFHFKTIKLPLPIIKRFVAEKLGTSPIWRPMLGGLVYRGLKQSDDWYDVVRCNRWEENVRSAVLVYLNATRSSPTLVVQVIGTMNRWDAMKIEYGDVVDTTSQEAIKEIELYKRWLCGETLIPASHLIQYSPFDEVKKAIYQCTILPSEVLEMIMQYLVE